MRILSGALAQLARAPRLHRGGQGFESPKLHQIESEPLIMSGFNFI